MIVTTIRDHVATPGHLWVRADEVVTSDELAADDASVRLATRRGSLVERLDAELTDLAALLDYLAAAGVLVLVHLQRTGSWEGFVGRIIERTEDHVSLDEVDSNARHTGEDLDVSLDQIIGVVWGDGYLNGLDELLAFEVRSHVRPRE